MKLKRLYSYIYKYILTRRPRNVTFTLLLLKVAEYLEYALHSYSNTKIGDSNHHYVPQHLLERFKVNLPECKRCLHVFDKKTRKILSGAKSIRSEVACSKNFYDVRDKTGSHSNFVEQKLFAERIEVCSAKLFTSFEDKIRSELTYGEEIILNNFIASQIIRTPFFRGCVEAYITYLINNDIVKQDDLNSNSFRKALCFNEFNLQYEEVSAYKNIANPSIIEGDRAKGLLTSLCNEMIDSVARSLWGMQYILMKAKPGTLLISDNPVITFDTKKGVTDYIAWWDLKDKDVLLPVSDTELIVGSKKRPKQRIDSGSLCEPFFELSNYGQFVTATHQVCGKDGTILENASRKFGYCSV